MTEPSDRCEFTMTNGLGELLYECENTATVWIGASCDQGHQLPASFCDRHAIELIDMYEDENSDQIMCCELCYNTNSERVFTTIDDVLGIGGVTPDKLADVSFPREWLRETP